MDMPFGSQRSTPERDVSMNPSPSPASLASPVTMSTRTSEAGETSCDGDDVMLFCDRRRTVSSSASFNPDYHDISRDLFAKVQYPELYKMLISHRQNPSGEIEVPDKVLSTDYRDIAGSRELLFREALSLFDKARKLEKHNRELKKNYEVICQQNKDLREASFKSYARTEQEEEYISNLLLKRIEQIKNDKEAIVRRYEKDEEMATKELQHKVRQLENARAVLEERLQQRERSVQSLQQEQIESQERIDQLRREKVDQANTAEQEQEFLFHTLGRQMEDLNSERKRRKKGHSMNSSSSDDEVMNFFLRDNFLINRAKEYGITIDTSTRERVALTIHGIIGALENQIQSFRSREAAYQEQVKRLKKRVSVLDEKICGFDLSTDDFTSRMSSLISEFLAETKEIRSPSDKQNDPPPNFQRMETSSSQFEHELEVALAGEPSNKSDG